MELPPSNGRAWLTKTALIKAHVGFGSLNCFLSPSWSFATKLATRGAAGDVPWVKCMFFSPGPGFALAAKINCPGATISGLTLPSAVGPLDENAAIFSHDPVAWNPLYSGPSQYELSLVRGERKLCLEFWDAPTVIPFFATPGDVTVRLSGPLFPAEITIQRSWFFQTKSSNSIAVNVYSPLESLPQELEKTLAPDS